jgi:hypothetical protein
MFSREFGDFTQSMLFLGACRAAKRKIDSHPRIHFIHGNRRSKVICSLALATCFSESAFEMEVQNNSEEGESTRLVARSSDFYFPTGASSFERPTEWPC